ncbi:DUF5366 family protein [Alkalihalobacillus pseudalcaliphilus]|uniref:DUF5366 family protein n=1 Tax=Alkalihalobacillus pseudalcaliphilus TaxID=79884 RepID=UPI00064DB7BF|nr:DUF5366 family protein [Alkalihalobacillus pseudalcaliphilus]KMK75635.1 membrane protein [Alkalihalobacillus pseudalcaliphilus]
MSNRYITSHFPLISIVLFSLAFALFVQGFLIEQLMSFGLYEGMREFFSENGIKLTLLFLLLLLFFMVFSALKLIADTTLQLSLLFFSNDEEGKDLIKVRTGSWVFFISGMLSLFLVTEWRWLLLLFLVACLIYFVYFIYQVSDSMSFFGMFGMVFFHVIFWTGFLLLTLYAAVKLYNSFIASLP